LERIGTLKRLIVIILLVVFALTSTAHAASAPEPILFTVIDERYSPPLTKTFTEVELQDLHNTLGVTRTFSSYNTFPVFKQFENVTGITVDTILSRAGIPPRDPDTLLRFTGKDGYFGIFTAKDLGVCAGGDTRFAFPDGVSHTGKFQVDPVLDFFGAEASTVGGRLIFGQLTPQDQTNDSFIKEMRGATLRILAQKATAFTPITTANVKNGETVKIGTRIHFEPLPSANGRAKVHYTLDGTDPTIESAMYNYSEWLPDRLEMAISLDSLGTKTIKTRVIGRGGLDSAVTTFT
jgi:hypothetical protein